MKFLRMIKKKEKKARAAQIAFLPVKHLIMDLTISDIKADIEGYQARITEAHRKLAALPVGYLPLKEHRRREKQCRDLQDDIRHCERHCEYGKEGIKIRMKERNHGSNN